jgi:putative glycosyltransferase (TIGR04372 family)
MFTGIIKFFNNLDKFPFYTISLLPYSFGDSLEQLKLGHEIAKKKKKILIFITVTIAQKLLKYKIASKFLITKISLNKKNLSYYFFRNLFIFFLNVDFFFKRFFFLFFKTHCDKYDFPYLGLEDLYENNDVVKFNEEDKIINYKLDLFLSKTYDLKSQKLLDKIGIKNTSKIVCIHTRDGKYHNDFLKRKFRNPDIKNYYQSINYLLNKGYSVIRFTLLAEKKYQIEHENFFDLPFLLNPKEIEFLQFYIVKNCSFFIANDSGPQYLPWLYGKPTLFTNIYRIFYINSPNQNCRYLTREFYDTEVNKILSLNEFLNLPYKYHQLNYKDDRIKFIENSSVDLFNSIIEFEKDFVNNSWGLSNLQNRYNEQLKMRFKKIVNYEGTNQDENFQKQKNKKLLLKSFLSNNGSATNAWLKKSFF